MIKLADTPCVTYKACTVLSMIVSPNAVSLVVSLLYYPPLRTLHEERCSKVRCLKNPIKARYYSPVVIVIAFLIH